MRKLKWRKKERKGESWIETKTQANVASAVHFQKTISKKKTQEILHKPKEKKIMAKWPMVRSSKKCREVASTGLHS